MGTGDHRFGLDLDRGFDGTHKFRLRFSIAWAVIPDGETEIPAENYFDANGTDDVAVTAKQWSDLARFCEYAHSTSGSGGTTEEKNAQAALIEAAYPGILTWLGGLSEPERAAFLDYAAECGRLGIYSSLAG